MEVAEKICWGGLGCSAMRMEENKRIVEEKIERGKEGRRKGEGNNSGKDGGGTICHLLFYSHPEASERRQIPADYSVGLSNTESWRVSLCICRMLGKS